MLNQQLQTELTSAFKPLGIIAFSNCCRAACAANYADDDDFKFTERSGIYFFRLHLEGMNYSEKVEDVYASYDNFEYLMEHWTDELSMIDHWASILGLNNTEYIVDKPNNQNQPVFIHFLKPLQLEKLPKEDEDDDDDE